MEEFRRNWRTRTVRSELYRSGPAGRLNVVRVADIENLTKMRIGDTIVVTFTEAEAISVEKVAD